MAADQFDPKLVREVAREAMRLAASRRDDIDAAIRRLGGLGETPEDREALAAYRATRGDLFSAVRAEMLTAFVHITWPDERSRGAY